MAIHERIGAARAAWCAAAEEKKAFQLALTKFAPRETRERTFTCIAKSLAWLAAIALVGWVALAVR